MSDRKRRNDTQRPDDDVDEEYVTEKQFATPEQMANRKIRRVRRDVPGMEATTIYKLGQSTPAEPVTSGDSGLGASEPKQSVGGLFAAALGTAHTEKQNAPKATPTSTASGGFTSASSWATTTTTTPSAPTSGFGFNAGTKPEASGFTMANPFKTTGDAASTSTSGATASFGFGGSSTAGASSSSTTGTKPQSFGFGSTGDAVSKPQPALAGWSGPAFNGGTVGEQSAPAVPTVAGFGFGSTPADAKGDATTTSTGNKPASPKAAPTMGSPKKPSAASAAPPSPPVSTATNPPPKVHSPTGSDGSPTKKLPAATMSFAAIAAQNKDAAGTTAAGSSPRSPKSEPKKEVVPLKPVVSMASATTDGSTAEGVKLAKQPSEITKGADDAFDTVSAFDAKFYVKADKEWSGRGEAQVRVYKKKSDPSHGQLIVRQHSTRRALLTALCSDQQSFTLAQKGDNHAVFVTPDADGKPTTYLVRTAPSAQGRIESMFKALASWGIAGAA